MPVYYKDDPALGYWVKNRRGGSEACVREPEAEGEALLSKKAPGTDRLATGEKAVNSHNNDTKRINGARH